MHGDAAFAGQGVVAETLNLSQLRGYRTGGTVHVVVNNQVGFTTSPSASRSSLYCTDIARMIAAPIFHVNGDDPEACVRVAKLAVEYRREFKKDVVIDMVCYRRRGHNEADNPSFTQPHDVRHHRQQAQRPEALHRGARRPRRHHARGRRGGAEGFPGSSWRRSSSRPATRPAAAPEPDIEQRGSARRSRSPQPSAPRCIKRIADAYANPPEGFTVHPRLKPQIDRRVAMASTGDVDWATAELFAFGVDRARGHAPCGWPARTRRRGTFTQRHAVARSTARPARSTRRCATCPPTRRRSGRYDSLLSEFAAMGFEYGYSVVRDDALVCWEAQFGDFADGAQTIVDEFIVVRRGQVGSAFRR